MATDAILLDYETVKASGQGDITTIGSIADGETTLAVAGARSWREGHGIRVRRAGEAVRVLPADTATRQSAGRLLDAGAIGTSATTVCIETAASPAQIGDDVVVLCAIDIVPVVFDHDELVLQLTATSAVAVGDVHLRIYARDEPASRQCRADVDGEFCPSFELALPALAPNEPTTLFLPLTRRYGNGQGEASLDNGVSEMAHLKRSSMYWRVG